MITPEQIRAARAMLGLSQDAIASEVGTSSKTIQRAETIANSVSEQAIANIKAALEDAGIEFIEENGGGAGVRFRKVRKNG